MDRINRNSTIWRVAASLAGAAMVLSGPALAQSDDGSLDGLWNESTQPAQQQTSTQTETAKQKEKPKREEKKAVQTERQPEPQKEAQAERVETKASPDTAGLAGPLCSLDGFRASEFVQKGGFPGVGPFQSTLREPHELKDSSDNLLRLTVENQKVTGAELMLVKQPRATSGFLNLEMNADYLLEALGAKPGRISEFNASLEKSKSKLEGGVTDPISLSAGHYLISILPPDGTDLSKLLPETKEKLDMIIKINSKEASSAAIKAHSTAPEFTPPESITPSTTTIAAVPPSTVSTPIRATTSKVFPAQTPVSKPAPSASHTDEPLKQKFVELLTSWQSIKRNAVRNRVTSELPGVLSGRALTKQSDAIKWLSANHKYYDMVPKGVTVSKIQDLFMGKKYACFAQVKEASKYIDESTSKVLKDSEDTYNVIYTIEKINDRWFISDSAVPPKPGDKTTR